MAVLARRRTEEKRFAGLRAMDPMKDLRGVADLIEEAFASDLDRSGQSALQELRWLSRLKPILWWMVYASPDHTDFLSGFVWEEDKKIVGNITINRTSVGSRRWLISNLAVAKNYRGQGIARGLMYAAIELVKEYNGLSVALQVRADNRVARHLYESLHFKEISGTAYLWIRRVPKVEVEPLPKDLVLRVRNADSNDNREAYSLASIATPLSVQKEWPLRHGQFRLNQNETFGNFFRWFSGGGPLVHWVVEEGGRFIGLVNIKPGTWGQAHQIELIVHHDWRGRLERPLISRALAYLYPWRTRNIFIKHPAHHPEAVAVYKEFGFIENQTLIWMKREF
jgi:ribosomal protein S18 acetylase RimI-like enzyme